MRWVLALFLAAGVATAGPELRDRKPRIGWSPDSPVEGSFVQVNVRPSSDSIAPLMLGVSGTLGGQQLHFEQDATGGYRAVVGIPIEMAHRAPLALSVRYADGTSDEVLEHVPVARGEFPVQALSVARRFVDPPDSALAVRIRRERTAASAVSRDSHNTPRLWATNFMRPRTSRVTSAFALRREFNGQLQSRHMGLDLAGDYGAPVVASNRGVVAMVGDFYYAGNCVYLDHGRGVITSYMHLSEVTVAQGDTVERGQMIGKVGATGRVTGPHLHWVARYGSVSLDPLSLVELDLTAWP